jgi:hypothetical protein
MSKNVISMLGAAIVGVVLVGSATQGCGGGGGASSADVAAACTNLCNKEASCNPAEAALIKASCMSGCSNTAAGGSSGTGTSMTDCPGLSESDAITKVNACANGTCDALDGCLGAICPSGGTAGTSAGSTAGTSGGGTAGTSGGGTAGTSGGGTAGTSGGGTAGTTGNPGGTTCDTACAKADACANAVAVLSHSDAGSGTSLKTGCDSQSAADQVSTVSACNMILSEAAMLGAIEPTACK